jgi:hypothetical protein
MGKHEKLAFKKLANAIQKRDPRLSCVYDAKKSTRRIVIPGWEKPWNWIEYDLRVLCDSRPIDFFIEYDHDSDPGRSVSKYWPWLDSQAVFEGSVRPIVIFCLFSANPNPKGISISPGYFYTARFLAWKMMAAYPNLTCHVVRIDDLAKGVENAAEQIVSEWRRLWRQ